ncbi:hypothetical protein ACFL0H_03885 [Thermodesulfobacteriota bacterium]
MKNIFKMMTVGNKDKDRQAVRIGININIGESDERVCPVSRVCGSYDAFESEVRDIKENLGNVLSRAKRVFEKSSPYTELDLTPDMKPEEIWETLSTTTDEEIFIDGFNGMDEAKRKEVADHVLTRCNIFSGKGSLFSSRYNNKSGLLE